MEQRSKVTATRRSPHQTGTDNRVMEGSGSGAPPRGRPGKVPQPQVRVSGFVQLLHRSKCCRTVFSPPQ